MHSKFSDHLQLKYSIYFYPKDLEETPLENKLDDMFEKAWAEMEEKDWIFPIPVNWKPKDKNWQLWNE